MSIDLIENTKITRVVKCDLIKKPHRDSYSADRMIDKKRARADSPVITKVYEYIFNHI